jgi:hypothetical protein
VDGDERATAHGQRANAEDVRRTIAGYARFERLSRNREERFFVRLIDHSMTYSLIPDSLDHP